jgi:hypothetical protein
MGHAKIAIPLDRDGHRMPGSERRPRALLDTYLSA